MASRRARLDALLGEDLGVREVYRVKRGLVYGDALPRPGGKVLAIPGGVPKCWRCGAICSPHGAGQWAVLTVLSRIRGSAARGIQVDRLHVGCVSTDLGAPLGIPARKVRREG